MSTRLQFLLVLALASGSATALADSTSPSSPSANATTEARERFQRGVVLYREGSFDAALAEFRRAYELSPNYRVLYNLGQVQVERHDSVAALDSFTQYLQQGGSEIDPERKAQVERDMSMLRGRVAEITVTSNVPGARLSVDGVEVGTLPLTTPLLVNSGIRQIQLEKSGYRSTSRSLTIAGAQPLQVRLNLEPSSEQPSSASPARAGASMGAAESGPQATAGAPARSLSTPFWVSAVATGLFAGTAVTFGILAEQRDQKLDDRLNQFPTDEQAVADARSSLKRDAALTDVFMGASLVAGLATVYFGLTSPSTGERPTAKASARDHLRLDTRGSTLLLSGKF